MKEMKSDRKRTRFFFFLIVTVRPFPPGEGPEATLAH